MEYNFVNKKSASSLLPADFCYFNYPNTFLPKNFADLPSSCSMRNN